MKGQNKIPGKKAYKTPELTAYGTVAEITQFFGTAATGDLLISGSQEFDFGTTGSHDGHVCYSGCG